MADILKNHFDSWWQAILAIPPSRADAAYARLERVFRDQTRLGSGKRGQEFTDPAHEMHFTVTLWENFVLFPPAVWLDRVGSVARLSANLETVTRCNWSYQWAEHSGNGARHCDIVLEYEDAAGRGLIVVEAKKPGAGLSDKDLDPGYYLSIPQFAESKRRSMIYLIDVAARTRDESRVVRGGHDVGFLSWEQLASIQIGCSDALEGVPPVLQTFVAASIYRAFAQHGITPQTLPQGYLSGEPSAADVVAKRAGRPLGAGDWEREHWRL